MSSARAAAARVKRPAGDFVDDEQQARAPSLLVGRLPRQQARDLDRDSHGSSHSDCSPTLCSRASSSDSVERQSLRHKGTFWGVNIAERRGTHRSADAENWNKTERTGPDRNPFTTLWTTLSGFESLPPSHSQ